VGENIPKLQEGGQGIRLVILPSGAINPEQVKQLAELLKTTSIDFCISENSHFQATAQQILQYHPATLQFEVLREDFPEAWLQTIAKRSIVFASTQANSNQLITGLVVTGEYIVKRFIGQVLGMNSNQMERLQLLQRGISCIYYPYGDRPPVLQAMNISGSVEETYPGFIRVSNESL
jgi:probable phosphoglycerate mutase